MNIMNSLLFLFLATFNLFELSLHACYIITKEQNMPSYNNICQYYRQHKAKIATRLKQNFICFPRSHCKSIPLKTLSDEIRWFYTSAIDGDSPERGQALEIVNASITHVFAVRGSDNHHVSHVYFGINSSNPQCISSTKKKIVYEGEILYVFNKNIAPSKFKESHLSHAVTLLSNRIIENPEDNTIYLKFNHVNYGYMLIQIDPEDLLYESDPEYSLLTKKMIVHSPRASPKKSYDSYEHILATSNVCYWPDEKMKRKSVLEKLK